MEVFTAGIRQTEETIKRYAIVQYNIFQIRKLAFTIALSLFLAICGVLLGAQNNASALILVFLGCIIYTNKYVPATVTANKVIRVFNGKFPVLSYRFTENDIFLGEAKITDYKNLICLVEDESYLYFFQTSQYGIMVPKASVNGNNGAAGLRELVSKNTNLSWQRPNSLLNFNIGKLLKICFPLKR